MSWRKLKCNARDLQLKGTLDGGQSFRWKLDAESNEWTGVFSKTVWKLRESENEIQFKILGTLLSEQNLEPGKKRKLNTNEDLDKIISNYFRIDVDLQNHYKLWSQKDEHFKIAGEQFYGIRMLAQEPVENLFSFICSQNNHISRISSMVEKLCHTYGEMICSVDNQAYYAFPEVENLSDKKVEATLRELGFGYRAKFIQKSAEKIVDSGGVEWFYTLMKMDYLDAKKELMTLHGIGPKVADCICLMSLNHLESVPVDTHVFQIAAQNYLKHLRGKKSVTESIYREIGDFFRNLYGPMAGWAHTVLFCADLKKFKSEGKETVGKRNKKC